MEEETVEKKAEELKEETPEKETTEKVAEEEVAETAEEPEAEVTEEVKEEEKKPEEVSGFERRMYKAICADCGKECEVPFKPIEGRKIYCRDCYRKHRPSRGRRRF